MKDEIKPHRWTRGPDGERVALYRRHYKDPVTGKRESVIGTKEELASKIAGIETRRRELKQGLNPSEVARRHGEARGPVTIGELWRERIQEMKPRHGAKVRGIFARHVLAYPPFGKGTALAVSLDGSVMAKWLAWTHTPTGEPHAAKTRINLYNLMRAAITRALDQKRLEVVPWGDWRPPRSSSPRREALRNVHEVSALILCALRRDAKRQERGLYADLSFRILFELAFGLRQGEAAGIAASDFDYGGEEPRVHIQRQVTQGWIKRHPHAIDPPDLPKGEKTRELGLNDTALYIVENQVKNLKNHGFYDARGPLFPVRRAGRGASPKGWRGCPRLIKPEVLRELWAEAGLPNVARVTAHALRHSAGTLGAATGDLEMVREFLGHADLKVTTGYIHSLGRGLPKGGLVIRGFEPSRLPPVGDAIRRAPALLEASGLLPELTPRQRFKEERHRAYNKAYARTVRQVLKRLALNPALSDGERKAEAARLGAAAGRRAGRAVKANYVRALPPPRASRAGLAEALLAALEGRPPASAAELARRLAVAVSLVKRDLRGLVRAGRLVRHGPDRSPVALYGWSVEALAIEADRRYVGRLDAEPFAPVERALRGRREASAAELAAELGRAKKRVVYALSELADAGRARTIGKGPGARWVWMEAFPAQAPTLAPARPLLSA